MRRCCTFVPPYCYWWLSWKKRGWRPYRSPNPNARGGYESGIAPILLTLQSPVQTKKQLNLFNYLVFAVCVHVTRTACPWGNIGIWYKLNGIFQNFFTDSAFIFFKYVNLDFVKNFQVIPNIMVMAMDNTSSNSSIWAIHLLHQFWHKTKFFSLYIEVTCLPLNSTFSPFHVVSPCWRSRFKG